MSEVNIPLLRKAVEWAEAEAAKPALECRWEQREWVSSPADRAWFLADRELSPGALTREIRDRAGQIEQQLDCGTCYCIAGYVAQSLDARFAEEDDEHDVTAEDVATEALGLTRLQAGRLFAGSNTIEDVRRIAEDIAGERL